MNQSSTPVAPSRLRSAARGLLLAGTAFVSNTACADVTYLYVGNTMACVPWNGTSPCWNFGSQLTGSIVFDDAVLAPGYTGTVSLTSAKAFNLQTSQYSSSQGPLSQSGGSFSFVAGHIVAWNFGLVANYVYMGTNHLYGDNIGLSYTNYPYGAMHTPTAGAWNLAPAVAVVPLPAALPFMALGLLGGALFGRKRSA